ncbi:XkdX family protein [Paenibacillus pinisoli]|uniref:XkdX family protein n=1 Tax=Paenibacillus pinisoli TaxID=1276110 RepID=A0A3A6PJX3_9BACL|nr:XkdX family protein [Paenibacillus pinisoli]RJX40046.1 XkdX family protein [Paenibacillus pinisoli]
MTDFERVKFYYEKGWAQIPDLRQYVAFNKITPEQFGIITGQDY